ncbi:MAG: hypothetical protein GX926_02545 [Candidatus Magasanikbacteria bacterium]|nr:hypothetical protein [Candidatus Magasanikbacteria bacterium]
MNENKILLFGIVVCFGVIILGVFFLSGWLNLGLGIINNPEESKYTSNGISFTCPAGWSLSQQKDINNPHPFEENGDINSNYFIEHFVTCSGPGRFGLIWTDNQINLDEKLDETRVEIIRMALPHNATINKFNKTNIIFNGKEAIKIDYIYTIDFGTSGIEMGGPVSTTYSGERIAFNCANKSIILSTNSTKSSKGLNDPYFDQIKNSFTCQ